MTRVRGSFRRAAARVAGLPLLRQDALLYLGAGVFALGVMFRAVSADYREWAALSIGPYLGAALACELAQRFFGRPRSHALRPAAGGPTAQAGTGGDGAAAAGGPVTGERAAPLPRAVSYFRRGVILVLLVLAVVVPLALQLTWRADAPGGPTNRASSQAQPEVAVIERAGDRLAHFQNPYLAKPETVGVSPSNDSRSVNANSFFPYLPGMVPFGLANATSGPPELRDARLTLASFTLLVVALALALSRASPRRRWRAFQFLVVLPTGALPMVTGGDDLPVLALLVLGLVLVKRRQPVLAGVVMGLAGTLKWTAWPLVVFALFCVRDDADRPAVLRYGLTVLAVAVPVIGAGAALSPHAFLVNVVLFPLGLTHVHSPAASPMIGQVLVQLFPAYKKALTAAILSAGMLVVLAMLVRHPPRDASSVAAFTGSALAFATIIAPATRFGYFIYPANMLVWAYLLHTSGERRLAGGSAWAGEEVAGLASREPSASELAPTT